MSKSNAAVELYDSGFSCSQAVFGAFCQDYGLELPLGMRLSNGLSGGVQQADVCGAVSGAALVVGLKFGQSLAEDKEARSNCARKVREFLAVFRDRKGCTACRDLLGLDASTAEGRKEALERGLFKTVCRGAVESAARILEEQGY